MQINCGQYSFDLATTNSLVKQSVSMIYGDAPKAATVSDFAISLQPGSWIRRLIKPQVVFRCDQHAPFKPLPLSQAYAMLEWGMNWCIAAHEYSRFLLHAAVLVKNNKAIIFPALPGSGKSTLSVYLGLAGWSVYSDEMAIIDVVSHNVIPVFRPVCLKNDSISLVKSWYPTATLTPVCRDTQKGDVAHAKVLSWQHYQQLTPVPVKAVVFPKYQKGAGLNIYPLEQVDAFELTSRNAFNYNVLGETAFNVISNIVGEASLYQLEYDAMSDLAEFLSELVHA